MFYIFNEIDRKASPKDRLRSRSFILGQAPSTTGYNEAIEIRGVVSDVTNAGKLTIMGRSVTTDEETSFFLRYGGMAPNKAVEENDRVVVFGVSLEDGSLLARRILIRY